MGATHDRDCEHMLEKVVFYETPRFHGDWLRLGLNPRKAVAKKPKAEKKAKSPKKAKTPKAKSAAKKPKVAAKATKPKAVKPKASKPKAVKKVKA
ncbi:unnamed protein product [Nippostrongylus brasiliensis]|uniref:Transcriptional regulator n=1 Tax=Nippostrongylus brasiliensis TaxID=27835 RepID=A0A0N4YEA6_NIPBR|nr:unnamed protein product [Nippostrongylus brasiliensis]